MPGFYLHVLLFLFAQFARVTEGKEETTLKRGLYSRVEITGEKQYIIDSLTVEWIKINRSSQCLCFRKNSNNITNYSRCCGKAHFYLNNNTLVLENVTAHDEGVYMQRILTKQGTINQQNFTLIIEYPPNVIEIMVSRISNNVTLRCEVSGSFQHLMWKRDRVVIREEHSSSLSEKNQTLHISSSDSGNYSCTASNQYGESERHIHIDITGENSTVPLNQGHDSSGEIGSSQIVLLSGLALLGVSGLCVVFYCLYKHHHRLADNVHGIYQERLDTEKMTSALFICTDPIKLKENDQSSTAVQQDFGSSDVGSEFSEKTVVLYQVTHEKLGNCEDRE